MNINNYTNDNKPRKMTYVNGIIFIEMTINPIIMQGSGLELKNNNRQGRNH